MLLRKLKDQKGVTLVELILVIAVLGFVLAAALSFFLLGTRTFSLGSSQAKVQQEARLATTIVSGDLRTALNVRAYFPGDTWTADANDFVVQRIGAEAPFSLMYTRPSGNLETDAVFTNLVFNVVTDANGKRFIVFEATGVDRARQYTINSSMLLENYDKHPSLADGEGYTVIIFDK